MKSIFISLTLIVISLTAFAHQEAPKNKQELLLRLEEEKNKETLEKAFLSIESGSKYTDLAEILTDHTNLDTLSSWVYQKLSKRPLDQNIDEVFKAFRTKANQNNNKEAMARRLIRDALKESGEVFSYNYNPIDPKYKADITKIGIDALANNIIAKAKNLDITDELFFVQDLFPGTVLGSFGKIEPGFLPLQIAKRLGENDLKQGELRDAFINLTKRMKELNHDRWDNLGRSVAQDPDFVILTRNQADAFCLMQIKLSAKEVVQISSNKNCDDGCRSLAFNEYVDGDIRKTSHLLAGIYFKNGLSAVTDAIRFIENANIDWQSDNVDPFRTGHKGTLFAKVVEHHLKSYSGGKENVFVSKDNRKALTTKEFFAFVMTMKNKIGDEKWQEYLEDLCDLLDPVEAPFYKRLNIFAMLRRFGLYEKKENILLYSILQVPIR